MVVYLEQNKYPPSTPLELSVISAYLKMICKFSSFFTAADFPQLSPVQQKEVMDLLNQFSDIFVSGPTDYGLAKGVIHQIDTGDAPPFCAKPYHQVGWKMLRCLKNSSNFWTLGYWLLPKALGLPCY
ncbi:hypothetical protein DSO57_1025742 [Entomophthora muscae]|uniref:Uncharacterized protein n=1 Tax=Entomophthora muscae TaxID=34485 RepID=A0ACC2RGV6_9FUNG|nr:hypothetical protein DSO57_1025742 [Entomophthora muscae]